MSNQYTLNSARSKFHTRAIDLITTSVDSFSCIVNWRQSRVGSLRAKRPEEAWALAGHVVLLDADPPRECFDDTPLRNLAGAVRGSSPDIMRLRDEQSAWVRSATPRFDTFAHLHRIAGTLVAIELLIRADPVEGYRHAGSLVCDHLGAFTNRFFDEAPGFSLPVSHNEHPVDAPAASVRPRDTRHIATGLLLDGLHVAFVKHTSGQSSDNGVAR